MKFVVSLFVVLQSVLSFLNCNPLDCIDNPLWVSNNLQDCAEEISNNASKVIDSVSITLINGDYWSKCFGYSEDATLNFTELTDKYGYPTETHTVTTEDNYILTIFRLVKGKKCNGEMKRTPVVMMHGLFDSSDSWITSTPDAALAYLVSDECYDVWLPNHRGNKYSNKHLNYTADKHSEKYWNFTFDEHGMYDLKAIVDYVLDVTDSKQISYIGHSQGSTDFYVLTSTQPEYNAKFALSISLAPIAWLHHVISPLPRLLATASTPLKLIAKDLLQVQEFFSRGDGIDKIVEFICQFLPEPICGAGVLLGAGGDPTTIGSDNLKAIVGHYPDATSAKNLVHFAQGINVDRFAKYSYGPVENLLSYNNIEPPEYDVTKITAPVAIIASRGDLLSVIKDVAKLRDRLSNVVHYSEMDEFWGHVHYLLAKTVPTKLAPTVFELLKRYGSQNK